MTDVSIPPVSQAEIAPSQSEIAPRPREPELPATQIQTAAVQSGDQCVSCGALLATDQRYCLACGQRRGDPRLPFMDAVVLMDAVQRPPQAPPPPPKKKRSGISPNAALIAGVGTLLLALGIGVLIGRSGHQEVAQTAAAPQIIKVPATSGEESGSAPAAKATTGGGSASKAKTKKQKAAAEKAAEEHPAAEEILKPTNGVELAKPKTQPGDPCSDSQAGCENGKFNGNFFE